MAGNVIAGSGFRNIRRRSIGIDPRMNRNALPAPFLNEVVERVVAGCQALCTGLKTAPRLDPERKVRHLPV